MTVEHGKIQEEKGVGNGQKTVMNGASVGGTGAVSRRRRLGEVVNEADLPTEVVFDGNKSICRASGLSTVLHRAAEIYKNSAGSAHTYDLSKEAESIDAFVSHNWSVHRFKKLFCLALHYNLGVALVAALGMMIVAALLGFMGIYIVVHAEPQGYDSCSNARLLTAPTFLILLVFWRELQYILGIPGGTVFLDKTCVHQTDLEIQRQGILKLGAFLRKSQGMVSIYTDVYLQKLWTVYEVACFLCLHSVKKLVVVPTLQPLMVFGAIAISCTTNVLYAAILTVVDRNCDRSGGLLAAAQNCRGAGIAVISTFTMEFIRTGGQMVLLRRWHREKQAIMDRMGSFQVKDCKCFKESDRPIVYERIATLLRATGDAPGDATEQDALRAFDHMVRSSLPRALISSIGPLGLHYVQAVAMWFCSVWGTNMVDRCLLAAPPFDEEWVLRWRVIEAVMHATMVFGLFPLYTALMSKWCACCIRPMSCDVQLVTGVALFFVMYWAILVLFGQVSFAAVNPGPHRDKVAIGLVVLFPISVISAVYVFRRGRHVRDDDDEPAGSNQSAKVIELDTSEEHVVV